MSRTQFLKTSYQHPAQSLADAVAAPEVSEETRVVAALGKARDEAQARQMIQRQVADELVSYLADGAREEKAEATRAVMEMAEATIDAERRAAAAEAEKATEGEDVADDIMAILGVEFLDDEEQDDEMGSIKTSFLRNSTLLGMGEGQDIRELLLEETDPDAETRAARAAVGTGVGAGIGGGIGALLAKFRRTPRAAALGAAGAGALGALGGAASPASQFTGFDANTGEEVGRRDIRAAREIAEALEPGRMNDNFAIDEAGLGGPLDDVPEALRPDFAYAIDLDEALEEDPILAASLMKGSSADAYAHIKAMKFAKAAVRLEHGGFHKQSRAANTTALKIASRVMG